MSKKILLIIFIAILSLGIGGKFLYCSIYDCNKKKDQFTVGIISPLRHQALSDIVRGFREVISKSEYAKKINIIEDNAEGNINTQRTIFQKFIDKGVNIYAPIGTSVFRMSEMMFKNDREADIIGLAVNFHHRMRKGRDPCNLTAIDDTVNISNILSFINQYLDSIKDSSSLDYNKITVIYHDDDKILKEVSELEEEVRKVGGSLQRIMIHELRDLHTVAALIDKDSQAIFVLKDNLVVSGIEVLVEQARKNNIPLITSDEGSVLRGAHLALGVNEADIGREGGKHVVELVRSYFEDEKPKTACDLYVIHMQKQAMIYINKEAADKKYVDVSKLEDISKLLNYKVNLVFTRDN